MAATVCRVSRVLGWGVVALLVSVSVLSAQVSSVAAQAATPQATPVATGGVPCTSLFGIEDASAACVLVIHASPDAGPVDVYLDGALALPGVEYGILGDFGAVAAGEHQIQVTAAGAEPAAAIIDETVRFDSGVAYEVAAVGPTSDIHLIAQTVNTAPFITQAARIRVVHAAPDAPAIDLAVTGGDVLVSDLDYLAASNELEVPAGAYALEVRPAGGDEVIVSIGDSVLEANVSYTFYVIGLVADNTIGGFMVPVAVPAEAAEAATPVP